MAIRIERDFYKVLIVAASGAGKTYAFRNMDLNTTGFINNENKPLPFPAKFKHHIRTTKYSGALKALDEFIANPEITVVVLDSLSAMLDMLLGESRQNFSGWDIWNNYNKSVGELMDKIKRAKKEIIITAHYEILNIEGAPEKRLKIKGKEWEGVVEKEFTIVFYPHVYFKGGKADRYVFKLSSEGTSAKCPPAIFGADVFEVDNDFRMVYDKIVAFAMQSAVEVNTNAPITSEAQIFS